MTAYLRWAMALFTIRTPQVTHALREARSIMQRVKEDFPVADRFVQHTSELPVTYCPGITLNSPETLGLSTKKRTTETRKPKLLIVDNEIPFTRNLAWLFSRRDYEVRAAYDGASALHAIETQEFDVAILEPKMPGMDGITTLKELKKKQPRLEVIILTREASVESALDGFKLGAYDYTTKPLQFTDLEEKITQAYERKRLLQ